MIKHTLVLAAACAALSMAGSAMAATSWKVEAFGKTASIRTLLNDGRLVGTYDVFTFPDPSTCPQSHYPTTCSYPSTSFRGLRIFTQGQPLEQQQRLTDDYWGQALFVNHLGKVIHWGLTSDFTVLDLMTGQSTLFAPAGSAPAISTECDSRNGFFWRAWSDAGVLAGQPVSDCPNKTSSIFLWSGKTTQEISPPKGYNVQFVGINASSQVVASGSSRSFYDATALLWSKATGYKVLPMPLLSTLLGYTRGYATGINDAGDVVGYLATKQNGGMRAVVWHNGTPTDIGAKSGYKFSYAVGVTSQGVVVGCGTDTGFYNNVGKVFLWDQKTGKALPAPTSTSVGDYIPDADYCANAYALWNGQFIANQSGQWLLDQGLPAQTIQPADRYLVTPLK